MSRTVITNVRAVCPDAVVSPAAIWIEDGRIKRIDTGSIADSELRAVDTVIDGNGMLLIPGMIDVHIHGANGFDMMDGTEESVQQVSRACADSGCTSFLATSVSSSLEDLLGMIHSVGRVIGHERGAAIAGIHLEGPYLNVRRKGCRTRTICAIPIWTK